MLGAAGVASFPGFRPHPEVDLVLLAAGCGYWWATRRVAPARRAQKAWFWSGLAFLWAFAWWPVHDVGEDLLFSVHMVQHWAFAFLAPVLLLAGTPDDLVRWLVRNPVIGLGARVLARPVVALVLFNLETVFLHWKPVVNGATSSAPLHFLVHLALFAVALCFWFPVVKRVDDLPSLRPGAKVLYLIAQTFVPLVPVAFLALATHPVYDHYAEAPRLWGISALDDQQLAAGGMWLLSSIFLIGAITVVFFQWWAAEQRDERTATWPARRPAQA